MFWIREEGQSVTDEKNATRVTTQQVVSDNDIKSTEVSGGRVEHYPVIPHWSVLKWLRHFDCHCCHSGSVLSILGSSSHEIMFSFGVGAKFMSIVTEFPETPDDNDTKNTGKRKSYDDFQAKEE
ncbi:unnamed protein product [Brugia timori]|uniref:Ovule protein n=1 Tax=Brugia timori TaxID=42155 RepID=A0A0R3QM82_9BILA|nr:unnamed protein product [Brugia timori]